MDPVREYRKPFVFILFWRGYDYGKTQMKIYLQMTEVPGFWLNTSSYWLLRVYFTGDQ